jgi:two-component system response regulator VanR
MKTNILVVDDEKEIADLVELYLKNEDYEVFKFYNAKDALDCVESVNIDLAILDIMLPEMNGYDICKIVRQRFNFPIIFLSAKVEDIDKIKGLTLGADDYITKPFNPLEMVARVKSQLRRYKKYNENNNKSDIIDFSGLVINKETHRCYLYEKEIFLTPIEFSILWLLCENRGTVISTEKIFESVWKEKYLDSNNTVMVHIKRLREKMNEKNKDPKFIKTVWGVGYKIDE